MTSIIFSMVFASCMSLPASRRLLWLCFYGTVCSNKMFLCLQRDRQFVTTDSCHWNRAAEPRKVFRWFSAAVLLLQHSCGSFAAHQYANQSMGWKLLIESFQLPWSLVRLLSYPAWSLSVGHCLSSQLQRYKWIRHHMLHLLCQHTRACNTNYTEIQVQGIRPCQRWMDPS